MGARSSGADGPSAPPPPRLRRADPDPVDPCEADERRIDPGVALRRPASTCSREKPCFCCICRTQRLHKREIPCFPQVSVACGEPRFPIQGETSHYAMFTPGKTGFGALCSPSLWAKAWSWGATEERARRGCQVQGIVLLLHKCGLSRETPWVTQVPQTLVGQALPGISPGPSAGDPWGFPL